MKNNLFDFQIGKDKKILDAFEKISINKKGIVFIIDNFSKVIGSATDGDIRRCLMNGKDLSSSISDCMNKKFTFALESESRENILKKLDSSISCIPVLSKDRELLDILMSDNFPLEGEKRIVAKSKSPARISFGGGGTDLTHYFVPNGGVVLNATIKMFTHATLRKRKDKRVKITSFDIDKNIDIETLDDLERDDDFKLIAAAIKLINPEFGFELHLYSDFPVGSGLGGSSVMLSSIFGCFNQFREDKWDDYEISEMAFQAERIFLNMAGGWQDQYATVFGGFNFMEFKSDGNVIHPLRISQKVILELEENLLLCHTNLSHDSDSLHKEQKSEFMNNKEQVNRLAEESKSITNDMKTDLLKGRFDDFGKRLDLGWKIKKNFSKGITDEKLDYIYHEAMKHGALGGKLLGAGGGGYFLFYVRPFERLSLVKRLKELRLDVLPLLFDRHGLQSWSIREN